MKKNLVQAEDFLFPPSVQADLFNYLKPEQQEFVRPILRVLKKPAQEELCCMLLDYMETAKVPMTDNVVVGGMFNYLTLNGMRELDDADNPSFDPVRSKRIIRPLPFSSTAPRKIGEVIDRLFPSLKRPQNI